MPPNTVDTAVLFWPRGGSAQVIRYLLREFNSRGLTTRLHAGSLGNPGAPSHALTFYEGLDLHAYDHNGALEAFNRGEDPQHATWPFHPSYEDRGTCPDPQFSAVPPEAADHLTHAWTRHLTAHRTSNPQLLHLHHLSHLQTAARVAYPGVPRVTTLHGTELKLIDAMEQRILLARSVDTTLAELGRLLHSDNPNRTVEAVRLARSAHLNDDEAHLLTSTHWQKWTHSVYWLSRLRRAATHAGKLISVSEHDAAFAEHLLHLPDAPPVIPNGVDTHAFQSQRPDDAQRMDHLRRWLVTDPHGWLPGGAPGTIRYNEADLGRLLDPQGRMRPLILWVGRFLDFKRVPVLLHAFATAHTRLEPAPALLMWGGYPGEWEGEHPAQLAAELGIDQSVFFIGWRGHDELPTGLNCADLMAAPAVDEPFGMIYLEAMACGVPPVATATGGPARTITPSGSQATGWLVAPDDAKDLADTLIAAVRDTTERQRRGANGRTHVQSTYGWNRTADRYLDVYDTAPSNSSRRQRGLSHPASFAPAFIDGLLLDMNGLFRHWRDAGARASERLAGLPEGTIAAYAYGHPAYGLARVGILTDQQWADDVADRLARNFGPHVREALGPWRTDRGEPDPRMVNLLAEIREHLPVGVLSNSTDALRADLQFHGITFDHVFPSAELGVDKPSPHAFRSAAASMGISTQSLAYFDDEPTFVHAARTVGMHAELFTGASEFVTQLRSHGIRLTEQCGGT